MKYIKKFKNNKESDYVGKFCVTQTEDDNDVKMSILQCNRVDFPIKSDINVFVSFECFDIDNNNISYPVGDNESLSIEDFNKINFMNATEFYNSYKDICEKLYYKIIEDLKNVELEYWRRMILKNYKKELDKIPEFKFFVDSDKFNI